MNLKILNISKHDLKSLTKHMKLWNKVAITSILTFVVRFLSTSPYVSTGIQASSSASVEPITKKRKVTDEGPTMKKTALW